MALAEDIRRSTRQPRFLDVVVFIRGSEQEDLCTMDAMARILVIDDDAQIRKLLREMLEHIGHEVTEAPNAAVGMQCYRMQPTDLVITDLCMPGMNGLDVLIDLRRDFPEARIIAMSGDGGGARDLLAVAKALGAIRTLQKPFNLSELIETLEMPKPT